jgi:hypothetical protein
MALLACGQGTQVVAEKKADAAAGGSTRTDRPATRTLGVGGTIDATMSQTITSRSSKPGETVNTTVDADTKDVRGRVVIPAGSVLELTISEITPAKNRGQEDGTLVLQVAGVTVRGQRYPLEGHVTTVSHTLQGRGVTVGEVEKVAVGTAIGAVAGQVIGGNAKGAIIGGAVGAAGGTVVAIQTASRDVVVSAGSGITVTLTGPLTVTGS